MSRHCRRQRQADSAGRQSVGLQPAGYTGQLHQPCEFEWMTRAAVWAIPGCTAISHSRLRRGTMQDRGTFSALLLRPRTPTPTLLTDGQPGSHASVKIKRGSLFMLAWH
eukprot:356518-Chlamydomonas_euryale.AAC.1